jgi:hypothetical protein
MTTLAEYFRTEADAYIDRMVTLLESGAAAAAELRPLARGLRGTAQLARQDDAHRAAGALEAACRAAESGYFEWDDAAAARARETLGDLRTLLAAEDDAARVAAADAAVERWQDTAVAPAGTAPRPDDDFEDFAIRELKVIVAAIEQGLESFAENPEERTPVHRVLSSQGALLGASRLDDVPIVGESLHALDTLARLILRLGVPVKREWLDVFRAARDVLAPAGAALARGEEPETSPALSRLRTLRDELSERHRPRDSAPSEGDGGEGPLVDIRDLCFDSQSALRRATELRPALERAVAGDATAREALDELFDLIRLALE